MLKIKLTFEMDEESIREVFENYEIKFSKKKLAELKADIKENEPNLQEELQERFEEVIAEWIENMFNE